MSFQDITYIWLAVIVVAYISGWVAHIIGPRRNLSGVSYRAPLILPQSVRWGRGAARQDHGRVGPGLRITGACPRDAPELTSPANDRRQQQPANMKLARVLNREQRTVTPS